MILSDHFETTPLRFVTYTHNEYELEKKRD